MTNEIDIVGLLLVLIGAPLAMIGIPMMFDIFILRNKNYWWHRDKRDS